MREPHHFESQSREALLDHFRLREEPFGVTPDPRYLYLSATHRRALGFLTHGLEAARGFLVLTAEPGLGKTTLLFLLLRRLEPSARTAFVFQTPCNPRDLLLYLLADVGIDADPQDLTSMQQQVREVVAAETRSGRRLVVIIDEAQNLESPVFETVRQLSDFEGPQARSLEFVLAGQLQLAEKLARPALARFRQQVSLLAQLDPLSAEESDRYIDHRLRMAGHSGDPLFTSDAREVIARWSAGVPRNINNVCFNALVQGYVRKREVVDASIVKHALAAFDLSGPIASLQDGSHFDSLKMRAAQA